MNLQLVVNLSSVAMAVGSFFVVLIIRKKQKQAVQLEDLIKRALSASALPTGVVLLLCAFHAPLLTQITGLNIHIAVAGLSLLFVAGRTLFAAT